MACRVEPLLAKLTPQVRTPRPAAAARKKKNRRPGQTVGHNSQDRRQSITPARKSERAHAAREMRVWIVSPRRSIT